MSKRYKLHRDYGFFDQDIRLSKLSELGDPLERLNKGIDFEYFRALLESRLSKEPKGKGCRPPYDYVLMFKILILQRYYNLSEYQTEYQINGRMSFMRFLGLTIPDDVPYKKSQKDIDAYWTKKNFQNYYGYKNHEKLDASDRTPKVIKYIKIKDTSKSGTCFWVYGKFYG